MMEGQIPCEMATTRQEKGAHLEPASRVPWEALSWSLSFALRGIIRQVPNRNTGSGPQCLWLGVVERENRSASCVVSYE